MVGLGMMMFDPKLTRWKFFDQSDGITAGAFIQSSAYAGRNGKMHYGGSDGFVTFYPDSIHENTYVPPVVLTSFKVFEQSRQLPGDYKNGISLSYEENYFSFEFAALSFTSPEKNVYRYKLEGFDNEWVSSDTRRYAAYTRVEPGSYIFKVQGTNNDGVWNTDGAEIPIHIIPPYWATLWFRISMALIFIFAVGYVVWRRFVYLEERTRQQQELSRRLLESQENERKRIGTSLHDSLGQNLLVIKNLAVMAIDGAKTKKDTVAQLNDISSLASNVLAEVREISYNLRPYHIDQLGLTGALRSIISRIESSSQIRFEVDLDDLDNLFPHEQDINVYRIVQEALNNIIKHSRAKNASVQISRVGDNVVFTIKDDGAGFAHQQRGFGLTGMEERTRILGGSIDIKSTPGAGSTIVVTIPVRSSYADK
jgi:signal transduction histidine kinase